MMSFCDGTITFSIDDDDVFYALERGRPQIFSPPLDRTKCKFVKEELRLEKCLVLYESVD